MLIMSVATPYGNNCNYFWQLKLFPTSPIYQSMLSVAFSVCQWIISMETVCCFANTSMNTIRCFVNMLMHSACFAIIPLDIVCCFANRSMDTASPISNCLWIQSVALPIHQWILSTASPICQGTLPRQNMSITSIVFCLPACLQRSSSLYQIYNPFLRQYIYQCCLCFAKMSIHT